MAAGAIASKPVNPYFTGEDTSLGRPVFDSAKENVNVTIGTTSNYVPKIVSNAARTVSFSGASLNK